MLRGGGCLLVPVGEAGHCCLWTTAEDKPSGAASGFMSVDRSAGLIAPQQHCYRRSLQGTLPNQDTWAAWT